MFSTNYQQGTVVVSSWLNTVIAFISLRLFPFVVPTYTNRTVVITGGFQRKQIYKTATGVLRTVV